MTEAALTTLSADNRSARATARQLAAQVDDGSELGHALRGVLEDVANGRSVMILRPHEEVTPAEAAKVLGVTRQFVDRLCAEGVLAFRRLPSSRHRKILLSDVLAVAAERDRRREGAAAIRSVLDDPS
jgi:excisionase family DNA binding protein